MAKKSSIFILFMGFFAMLGVVVYIYQHPIRRIIDQNVALLRTKIKVENFLNKYCKSGICKFPEQNENKDQKEKNDFLKLALSKKNIAYQNKKSEIILPKISNLKAPSILENKKIRLSQTEMMQDASLKEKIKEHLLANLKVEFKKASPYLQKEYIQSTPAQFELEIEKSGLIKKFMLVGSTGSELVDEFICKTISSAQPFPPIPSYLGISSYVLGN